MELKEMIEKLLESGMIESQELGTVLMGASEMTDEEKQIHINKFLEDFSSGTVDFLSDERKNLYRTWVELYTKTLKNVVKNRVKKIT